MAVSGVANDRCRQKGSGEVLLGFFDTFGQLRNRHTYIGRPELPALAQRLIGVCHVMARAPKPVPILRLSSPGKTGAAMLGGDHLNHLRLLYHAMLSAV